MSVEPPRPPADAPRRPAREDEVAPGQEMREADRANGEPDAADAGRASPGFEDPEKGTTGAQPEGEPRPPAESKEMP